MKASIEIRSKTGVLLEYKAKDCKIGAIIFQGTHTFEVQKVDGKKVWVRIPK